MRRSFPRGAVLRLFLTLYCCALASLALARVGGEVIGYTTDNVISHYMSLDNQRYTTIRGDLVGAGHTLIPIDSLHPVALDGLDRLIVGVVEVYNSLTPAQVDVIEEYVLRGGNLVFLGENNTYFRDNNVAVGGRFGITYPDSLGDPLETILDDVGVHPIMQSSLGSVVVVDGTNNSPGFYGSMSSPGVYGRSILHFPGEASACVVIERGSLGPGSGLVVAVAEVNIWRDDHIDEADNRVFWNNIFAYSGTPTAIGDPIETPYANESYVYPNPFTDKTVLTVGLIEPSHVRIEVFDVSGRLVRVMTSPSVTRLHQVEFDGVDRQGRPLPSGVYFLRARAKDALITQKMVITR